MDKHVEVRLLSSSQPVRIPDVSPPTTDELILAEMRAQTELLSRVGLVIAQGLGCDPVDSARLLSLEAVRAASSQVRSASPAASQSSPEPHGCSESAEGEQK